MLSLQKIIIFSLFTPQFFTSILHVKPDKQRGVGRKLEVLSKHFFRMTQSLFDATKIYILAFSLTHFLISLIDSFHFPQWKMFFPIH